MSSFWIVNYFQNLIQFTYRFPRSVSFDEKIAEITSSELTVDEKGTISTEMTKRKHEVKHFENYNKRSELMPVPVM